MTSHWYRKPIPFHASLVLLAGLVLFLKPWLADFTDVSWAAWNTWITGALVMIIAAYAYHHPGRRWRWLLVLVAVWFLVAPWVLSFGSATAAALTHAASALGLALLAAASLLDHDDGA